MSPRAIRRGRARAEARRARRLVVVGGIGAALAAPAAAGAADFQVTNLDDAGDGSLRSAIAQAGTTPGADTVTFAPGLSGTIRLATQLQIEGIDPITIDGPGPDVVTVSGDTDSSGGPTDPDTRIFSVAEATPVEIRDLTLTGGNPDPDGTNTPQGGGALYVSHQGATVTIANSVVSANAAGGGGGAIHILAGDVAVTDSVLSGNSTEVDNSFEPGGAAFVDTGGALEVESSELTGNVSAADGGAIATAKYGSPRPQVSIAGSDLSGNSANGAGGAVSVRGGDLAVEDSQLTGNTTSSDGGAIATTKYSVLEVKGSTLTGNTAGTGSGGAIFHTSSRPNKYGGTLSASNSVVGSTISGNEASDGGGLYIADLPETQSFAVADSTISGNEANGTGEIGRGGGVALYRGVIGDFDLFDTTISGNTANLGGGVAVGQAGTSSVPAAESVDLYSATIADNEATTAGGGLHLSAYTLDDGVTTQVSQPVLYSDIVGDNRVGTEGNDLAAAETIGTSGVDFSVGYSLIEEPGTVVYTSDPSAMNIVGQDPRLLPLADNGGPTETHLPANSSPAIDTGTNPGGLPFDQRGLPRTVALPGPGTDPVDGTDMGAVELQEYRAPRPEVTSGPSGQITATSATFAFRSDQPDATFECRLDGGPWQSCTSPRQVTGLAQGPHSFAVRATSMGVTSAPVSRAFRVADTTAPRATITKAPRKVLRTKKARAKVKVAFRSDEPGSTFQCKVGKGAFEACASPLKVQLKAKRGKGRRHTIQIRAVDAAGNAGPIVKAKVRVVRKG